MVVMQLLFDSLSRCFGLSLHPDDNHGTNHRSHRRRSSHLGSQPLGASTSQSRTRSSDHLSNLSHDDNLEQYDHGSNNDHTSYIHSNHSNGKQYDYKRKDAKLHDPEWDNVKSSACCFSPTANPIHEHDITEYPLLEPSPGRPGPLCNMSLSRPKRHTNKNSSTSLSSSISKDTLFQKARKESAKRKLDIFRHDSSSKQQFQQPYKRLSTSSPSLASRFVLGGGSSTESSGAMLCFANPIFDSEDDDPRSYRDGHDRDGEDTITSTLFFESKYEHVVQNEPPIPLFYSQALRLDEEHDNEILKLFENGCIKHEIKSIVCHSNNNNSQRHCDNDNEKGMTPPPPPPQEQSKSGPRSMADSTSSDNEDVDEYYLHHLAQQNQDMDSNNIPLLSDLTATPHNHHNQRRQHQQHHDIQMYKSDDGFASTQLTTTMSTIPSPPSVKSRQDLNSISKLVFDDNDKNVVESRVSQGNMSRCRAGGTGGSTSPPTLKLMNNSTLSTHALTPVNSASTCHLSPKKEDCTYVDPFVGEGNMEAILEI